MHSAASFSYYLLTHALLVRRSNCSSSRMLHKIDDSVERLPNKRTGAVSGTLFNVSNGKEKKTSEGNDKTNSNLQLYVRVDIKCRCLWFALGATTEREGIRIVNRTCFYSIVFLSFGRMSILLFREYRFLDDDKNNDITNQMMKFSDDVCNVILITYVLYYDTKIFYISIVLFARHFLSTIGDVWCYFSVSAFLSHINEQINTYVAHVPTLA